MKSNLKKKAMEDAKQGGMSKRNKWEKEKMTKEN